MLAKASKTDVQNLDAWEEKKKFSQSCSQHLRQLMALADIALDKWNDLACGK